MSDPESKRLLALTAPRFSPGVSGNPGGRPKGIGALRALARQHSESAIATLVSCLSDEDGRVRCVAADTLLKYGWGRPIAAAPDAPAPVNRAALEHFGPEELAALRAFHDAREKRIASDTTAREATPDLASGAADEGAAPSVANPLDTKTEEA